ncbi:ATP/GTP-binding protein [Kitasatospora sp. MBT63]|uniref:ATP/GTP-binding protein n=1 Tax=Kitasatospora sp. MBT63 TaxID=1444768 RepID=UPI00068C0833|nr:ATP/GTP-binding protein [Kitasatospora sp. MBT63]
MTSPTQAPISLSKTPSDDDSQHAAAEDHEPAAEPQLYIAREELTLALPDYLALRDVPLQPDPLTALAGAFGGIRPDLGEQAEVSLDLVPLSPRSVNRKRQRLLKTAHRRPLGAGPMVAGMPHEQGAAGLGLDLSTVFAEAAAEMRGQAAGGRGPSAPRFRTAAQAGDQKTSMGKFAPANPDVVFALQLLIRAQSADATRPRLMLEQIRAALEIWAGHNHFRPVGANLGITRLSADGLLYRASFDRRFGSGLFEPRGRYNLVTSTEIAGLVKPPTRHNSAPNIARAGGAAPPAPPELPEFTGQDGVFPLGYVAKPGGGWRLVGLPLEFLLFGLFLGKSGYGKTEMALVQAIALAHQGHGILFLDPHGDGWQRARPYLAHASIADRLWEIDLTSPSLSSMVGSWNPLSMERRSRDEISDIVGAIVTGIGSALSWGDTASRAKTILTRAVESLAHISYYVTHELKQPELAPTLFQIRTILTDEDFRDAALPHLPPTVQEFWLKVFPKYPPDAMPVVTNIIERLDSSTAVKAFLGSSRSTYDIRHAMDNGKVVFVCPSGTGDTDKIISCLLLFDLFRAGLSRKAIPANERLDFFAFIDELTAVDGASKGTLAAITEQLRKYRVKMLAMTQMAQRLTTTTRQGLLQNLSILSTAASGIDEAAMTVRQWGSALTADAILRLPRYQYYMSVALDGQATAPFHVRGANVEELYKDYCNPAGLPALDEAVNDNLHRRPVHKILSDLEQLNGKLTELLLSSPENKARKAKPKTDPEAPASPEATHAEKPRVHGGAGTAVGQPAPEKFDLWEGMDVRDEAP